MSIPEEQHIFNHKIFKNNHKNFRRASLNNYQSAKVTTKKKPMHLEIEKEQKINSFYTMSELKNPFKQNSNKITTSESNYNNSINGDQTNTTRSTKYTVNRILSNIMPTSKTRITRSNSNSLYVKKPAYAKLMITDKHLKH